MNQMLGATTGHNANSANTATSGGSNARSMRLSTVGRGATVAPADVEIGRRRASDARRLRQSFAARRASVRMPSLTRSDHGVPAETRMKFANRERALNSGPG